MTDADSFTALAELLESVDKGLRTLFRWLDEGLGTLDLVEWSLLALAAVLLWRWFALFRTRREVGPISVGDPTTPKADIDGRPLGAVMREALSRAGLSPTLLPAGRPDGTDTLVKGSPVARAGWIAALVTFVNGLVRRIADVGFRAEATLHPETQGPAKLTAVLRRNLSGRLVATETLNATTREEVAAHAGYWLYTQTVKAEGRPNDPQVATDWVDAEALNSYHVGLQCEGHGNLTGALQAYERSVEREPRNVLPRLAVANVHELLAGIAISDDDAPSARGALLDALAAYVIAAHLRPDEPEGSYRLAGLCSFTRMWRSAWAGVNESGAEQRRLEQLVGRIDTPTEDELIEALLERSVYEYDGLLERLSRARRELRPMVQVARMCAVLERAPQSYGEHDAAISSILAQRSVIWNTRYNAACYYAIAVDHAQPTQKRERVDRALELLDEVVADPRADVAITWIACADPDLQPLRTWLADELSAATDRASARRAAWRALFSGRRSTGSA
jgi:hypothetical protein